MCPAHAFPHCTGCVRVSAPWTRQRHDGLPIVDGQVCWPLHTHTHTHTRARALRDGVNNCTAAAAAAAGQHRRRNTGSTAQLAVYWHDWKFSLALKHFRCVIHTLNCSRQVGLTGRTQSVMTWCARHQQQQQQQQQRLQRRRLQRLQQRLQQQRRQQLRQQQQQLQRQRQQQQQQQHSSPLLTYCATPLHPAHVTFNHPPPIIENTSSANRLPRVHCCILT